MVVMCLVTPVLLYHSAIGTESEISVVSVGKRGNGGYVCSYCSTVTSKCYGYRE
jgi:hypothetical protein